MKILDVFKIELLIFIFFLVASATILSAQTTENFAYKADPANAGDTRYGMVQTWTVPARVTSIDITAIGAGGGKGSNGSGDEGGAGATIIGTNISVSPGDVLNIVVGAAGKGSQEVNRSAGGGGGSGVYNTAGSGTTLIVAGGGGGGGYSGNAGGNGGTVQGALGDGGASDGGSKGGGGGGATGNGTDATQATGGLQGLSSGGAGGAGKVAAQSDGGYGFGGGGGGNRTGGGGGGATGGATSTTNSEGGLGGQSYVIGVSSGTSIGTATNTGNGSVAITYIPCPDFTSITPAQAVISNSTCNTVCGTPSGGSIAAPTTTNCPSGSSLHYATDGTTFSATVPTYNQTTAQTITTKCVCGSLASGTAEVTTVPGTCPDFSGITPAQAVISNSTCNIVGGTPSGGSITAPTTTNCPSNSTLQYATDGTTFSATVPTYNQTIAQTITTKCVCDADGSLVSSTAEVTTVLGTCPSSINYGSGNRLTFGDPCKCDDPRNCQAGNTYYFHDTLRIPANGTMTAGLDIRINASSGFYIAVPCFGGALTEPTTGASGTRITETPTGSGVYKIEFWRPSGVQPTLSVLENGLVTAAPADTFQPVCTMEACTPSVPIPTMNAWGLLIFGLMVVNMGVFFVQRRVLI